LKYPVSDARAELERLVDNVSASQTIDDLVLPHTKESTFVRVDWGGQEMGESERSEWWTTYTQKKKLLYDHYYWALWSKRWPLDAIGRATWPVVAE
jgi:hypothetical protein